MSPFAQAEIEVHTGLTDIAVEWDALADTIGAPPFVRPGWFNAWWAAFGLGHPEVIAVRRAGSLVGVLPLYRRRGLLGSATNWHSPAFELVALDDAAWRELVAAVFRLKSPRGVKFQFLTAEETRAISDLADRDGVRVVARTIERSPFVAIDGDWPTYQRHLGRNMRRSLRRTQNRLQELGPVTFTVEDGRRELRGLLRQGFAVEASGWKSSRGTAILSRPETVRFYTQVSAWAARRGWLRLAFLRVADRPVAFHLCIEYGGVVYALKGGYDEHLRQAAPGHQMLHQLIAHAFASGLRRVELLGQAEPYKLAHTSLTRDRLQLQVFPSTAIGLSGYGASACARQCRETARRVVRSVRPRPPVSQWRSVP